MIIRIPNWLGDAVMAYPAIARYAENYPEKRIALMGTPLALSVYENAPGGFEHIPFDRNGAGGGVTGLLRAAAALREHRFGEGWLLTNSFSSALMFALSGVKKRTGYAMHGRGPLLSHPRQPPTPPLHQASAYDALLNGDARPPTGMQAKIWVSPAELRRAGEILSSLGGRQRMYAAMAPGASYGTAKRWPAERYADAARYCVRELGARVLLFGGANEREDCERVAVGAGANCSNLAGITTLRETFALLKLCRFLICNDSGMMHAAAALGVPPAAIFGPTDSRLTHPLTERFAVLDKHVDCAPCHKRVCPMAHHACMDEIHVSDVIAAIDEVMRHGGHPII